MDNSIVGMGIAIGLSSFYLYTRKKKWMNPTIRWIVCSGLFLTGLIGLTSDQTLSKDDMILFWGMCVPIAYYSTDRFFRFLSFKIYNRDFILWLRGSDEIDDTIFARNPHVKPYDKLFSVGLLVLICALIFVGAWIVN